MVNGTTHDSWENQLVNDIDETILVCFRGFRCHMWSGDIYVEKIDIIDFTLK